jgi:hypothetical protein
MGEEKTIRGRRVVFERNGPPRGPIEDLRYSIDVFDERGNQLEVLGRVAGLAVALAAFAAACAEYPDKRIFVREGCRVVRSSDRHR